MENKKTFVLKIVLVFALMFSVVPLAIAFRKVKAENNQVAFIPINQDYDRYFMPISNSYNGWTDSYIAYTTTNYAYIYCDNAYFDSTDVIKSVIITISFEFTSQSNIEYTNNQENECIAEFTTYYGQLDTSLDTYQFDYYIPIGDYSYGEDVTYSFYSDINYTYQSNQRLLLRIKRSFYNALDIDWYPYILPTTLSLSENNRYWYDFGYANGYDNGSDWGRSIGYDEGYYDGRHNPSDPYGIEDLLFSVFDAPYQVLYNVFSFTLFGTPMWTIIASLTAILLVVWLIKRFMS